VRRIPSRSRGRLPLAGAPGVRLGRRSAPLADALGLRCRRTVTDEDVRRPRIGCCSVEIERARLRRLERFIEAGRQRGGASPAAGRVDAVVAAALSAGAKVRIFV
jgi:hypothetical protein